MGNHRSLFMLFNSVNFLTVIAGTRIKCEVRKRESAKTGNVQNAK